MHPRLDCKKSASGAEVGGSYAGRVLANVPTHDDGRRRPKKDGRHHQMPPVRTVRPHFGELAGLAIKCRASSCMRNSARGRLVFPIEEAQEAYPA